MSMTIKVQGRHIKISRVIVGGYAQDHDGNVWIFNSQLGWVRVDTRGRAYNESLIMQTKASLLRKQRFRLRSPYGEWCGSIFDAERFVQNCCPDVR